jgi:hypothetical protein
MIVSTRSMSEADFRWNKGLALLTLDVLRRRYDCAHRYAAERGLSNLPECWFRNDLGCFAKIDSSAWLREATMVQHHPIRTDDSNMDSAYVPALAAFGGSAVGGLTSLAATWVTQRRKDSARRLTQERTRRQKLYKQFIDEASKLYADALVHDKSEVSALVDMYALIGRMRVLSSDAVIAKAEAVARMIIDTYFSPNKTFPELRQLMDSHPMDPLREFSEVCRGELTALK